MSGTVHLKCSHCNRVTEQMPVEIENGKVYFLCKECLSLNEMSVEAFKMLWAVAISIKKNISVAEALEEVEEKWRKLEVERQ